MLERIDNATAQHVLSRFSARKAVTQYSNNIRTNFGYLAAPKAATRSTTDQLFHQNGRKVFKEVCPMAAAHLEAQVASLGLRSRATSGAGGCTRPTST